MIAREIYYERVFPIQQFVNEKLGIVCILEPNETLDGAYRKANEILWDQHRKLNPQLYSQEQPKEEAPINSKAPYGKSLKEQLLSCSQLKVLESYKFVVRGKPEQELYDRRYKELENQTIIK
jgi:hypothetical protein